jgi:hypothetical protein
MGCLSSQFVGPLREVYRHNSLHRMAGAQTLYKVEMRVVRKYGRLMSAGEKTVIMQD